MEIAGIASVELIAKALDVTVSSLWIDVNVLKYFYVFYSDLEISNEVVQRSVWESIIIIVTTITVVVVVVTEAFEHECFIDASKTALRPVL